MHMRPPTHDATTKGENVRATNVEGQSRRAAETVAQTSTVQPSSELSQKEKDAVEALAKVTISTAPKAKAKGFVIQ